MDSRTKGTLLIAVILLLALIPSAAGRAGFESFYYGRGSSRGMVMYFVAFVVLLAIPLLNRYLKTAAFYVVVFALTRGLMRITDEQDPFRAVFSMETGLKVGLQIALPLVAASLALLLAMAVLRRIRAVPGSREAEVLDYISRGRKSGKTVEALRKELVERGLNEEEIAGALRRKDR